MAWERALPPATVASAMATSIVSVGLVASTSLGTADEIGVVHLFGRVFLWVAVAAWVLVTGGGVIGLLTGARGGPGRPSDG